MSALLWLMDLKLRRRRAGVAGDRELPRVLGRAGGGERPDLDLDRYVAAVVGAIGICFLDGCLRVTTLPRLGAWHPDAARAWSSPHVCGWTRAPKR